MCAAANSATDIATVSVFTNNGTILSLPHRNMPWPNIPNDLDVVEASRRIASVSQLTRPSIPTAIGHCFLIKRRALNLVGGFDTTFGTGYGEEVDFSQRLIQIGLRHIVADDVFVFHKIKKMTGEKMGWLRATGSTVVSQLVDSFVVLVIAFKIGNNWTWSFVMAVCVVNYMYKFGMAIILTPAIAFIQSRIENYVGQETAKKMKLAAMGIEQAL